MHYILQAIAENAAMHQQTRKNIRGLMLARKVASERQLALDCGMSQSTLNRFLAGTTETLEFVHIQSLAQYFSVTVSQLIGETPLEYDSKIRAVVSAMETMPEYQKDMLVAASSSLSQQSQAQSNGTNHR